MPRNIQFNATKEYVTYIDYTSVAGTVCDDVTDAGIDSMLSRIAVVVVLETNQAVLFFHVSYPPSSLVGRGS